MVSRLSARARVAHSAFIDAEACADACQIAEAKLPTNSALQSDQIARAAFGIATLITYAISPGDFGDSAPTLDHLTSVDDTIAEMLAIAASWS